VKVLVTDMRHATIAEEQAVLEPAGVTIDPTFSETEEELIKNGQGAIGFLVSYARVTRKVMEALPDLKIIVKYGIGVDNIDVKAATELGKYVANVPDFCIEEVALQTLSLVLTGLRMTHFLGGMVKQKQWPEDPTGEMIERPSLLNLGLVGLGKIARQFGHYMKNIVPNIYYYDPYVSEAEAKNLQYKRFEDVSELFEKCQIVSLHTPLTTETRGFVNYDLLSQAKDLILVNTSRGGVIDKHALARALDAGNVKFFGADVYWEEPPDFGDPWNIAFLNRKNVCVTPHVGWYSRSSEKEVRRKAATEVLRVIQGKKPLNLVNR
jgi:D-3-phosphoglycerate dehydrogenase